MFCLHFLTCSIFFKKRHIHKALTFQRRGKIKICWWYSDSYVWASFQSRK